MMENRLVQNYSRLVAIAKKEVKQQFPFLSFKVIIFKDEEKDWVGEYIQGTAIKNQALIRLSSDLPQTIFCLERKIFNYKELEQVFIAHLKDTIAHELIHAIQEVVYYKKYNSLEKIRYNEKEAEKLGQKISQNKSVRFHPLIKTYLNL